MLLLIISRLKVRPPGRRKNVYQFRNGINSVQEWEEHFLVVHEKIYYCMLCKPRQGMKP